MKHAIPKITMMAEAVVAVHGAAHHELHAIDPHWRAISGELVMHMQKEELMLFSYIRRLVRSKQERTLVAPPRFGSVAALIQKMEDEHESTGDGLGAIEELSHGFTPPADAYKTFEMLCFFLEEFQEKTIDHVHLENNILFLKAIALEALLA